MRKLIVIFLVLLLPTKLFSQEKHVVVVKPMNNTDVKIKVECDNKSSQSLNLTAIFNFNDTNEKLGMTLSYTSEVSNKIAGLWFPNESIDYKNLNKFFDRNERGLAIGTTMSKQVKNGVLENDIIKPALYTQNASLDGKIHFSKSFGNDKIDLDNQILTIENGSNLTATFTVNNNADSVIVRLNNLIPLTISQGSTHYLKKYQLQYIAKDIEIVILIDRDGCVDNLEDITYIDNMIAYYNKFDAYLEQKSKNCADERNFDELKENVLSGYDSSMLDHLRKSQCERLKIRLDSLDKIITVISNRTCTNCNKYVFELQSNYRVLDSKYQYMYELYKIKPRTDDVIEKFEDAKSDANKYIRNLDLTKYQSMDCSDVVTELNNVNAKIKQIKGLVINKCNLTKNQAKALSDEIKEAIKDINKKVNQYGVVNDVDTKTEVRFEILSTITTIDEKITALHSDCTDRFKDLKDSIEAYNEAKKLCKKKGIIND